MTQFEFISGAVSIVLALSAARLLGAFPHLLAPGRSYWVHTLWAVSLLPVHLGFWWAIWTYREVDPWTFRGFAAVMLTPALLFLTVSTLVSDRPSAVESWRSHFYARYRIFFSLFIGLLLSVLLRQSVVLGSPWAPITGAPAYSPVMLGFLLIPLIGIVATSERIHALLVVIATGLWLLNFAQL